MRSCRRSRPQTCEERMHLSVIFVWGSSARLGCPSGNVQYVRDWRGEIGFSLNFGWSGWERIQGLMRHWKLCIDLHARLICASLHDLSSMAFRIACRSRLKRIWKLAEYFPNLKMEGRCRREQTFKFSLFEELHVFSPAEYSVYSDNTCRFVDLRTGTVYRRIWWRHFIMVMKGFFFSYTFSPHFMDKGLQYSRPGSPIRLSPKVRDGGKSDRPSRGGKSLILRTNDIQM